MNIPGNGIFWVFGCIRSGASMRDHEKTEEKKQIMKAKQGDGKAFEFLVKKYQHPIYHLCRWMTGAHQAADDLAQDTFIKAYYALNSFQEDKNFYSWIRRIAVNKTLNFLKSRKREKPLHENIAGHGKGPPSSDEPLDLLQKKQMNQAFQRALHSLTTDLKTVYLLRIYENMSYKAIATALKIPPGTVMSRLNRARNRLKILMADYF